MAERRMFTKKITNSDPFTEMPDEAYEIALKRSYGDKENER